MVCWVVAWCSRPAGTSLESQLTRGCPTTGHCRHRKIRCIVSPEIQNRCINCIRVKKDCSFCPIDQQPAADSQGNTTGQGTGSSTAHSPSSSPALAPGNPTGMAARSLHGTGPVQDSVALASPVVMSSNVGYATVTGEDLFDARVLEAYGGIILTASSNNRDAHANHD